VDLFTDYDPAAKVPNIFRLMQLEEELGKALGMPVTITTRDGLHPLMKDQIEREAIRVL
jgi:predicted nucleotidyltransferase